jgi:hypothetical protein
MSETKQPNVDLHPAAHGQLKDLQTALLSEGVAPQARLQDIASALILYTPPQQAAGMLAAFSRMVGAETEGGSQG